jgi:hypothetical protein
MTDSFRLIQDGQPVAWAEGCNAFAEITHYAAVYGQDGPVTIQMKVNGRWVTGRKLEQSASLEARVLEMREKGQ